MALLDKTGLTYLINKIKTLLTYKVDKVTGKQLSDNNYSNDDKWKLQNLNVGFGYCETAGATAQKAVVLSSEGDWYPVAGSIICIRYTYTNTAQNPTIKVGTSAAYSVKSDHNTVVTNKDLRLAGDAQSDIYYMFDGQYYTYMSCTTFREAVAFAVSVQTISALPMTIIDARITPEYILASHNIDPNVTIGYVTLEGSIVLYGTLASSQTLSNVQLILYKVTGSENPSPAVTGTTYDDTTEPTFTSVVTGLIPGRSYTVYLRDITGESNLSTSVTLSVTAPDMSVVIAESDLASGATLTDTHVYGACLYDTVEQTYITPAAAAGATYTAPTEEP